MVVVAFSYACFGMTVSVARQMVFMSKLCPCRMATLLPLYSFSAISWGFYDGCKPWFSAIGGLSTVKPQLVAEPGIQIIVVMLVKGYPAAHGNASGILRKTDRPSTEIL